MEKLDAYKQGREEIRQEIFNTLERVGYEKTLLEDLSQLCVGLVEEGFLLAKTNTSKEVVEQYHRLGEYLLQCLKIGYETYTDVIKSRPEKA